MNQIPLAGCALRRKQKMVQVIAEGVKMCRDTFL